MSDADGRRVFFDTNVLVYSHDISVPEKCQKAKDLLNDAFIGNTGVVSGQVLSETFVTLTRKMGVPTADARDEIRKLSGFHVVDISSSLALRATEIQEDHQLSYWDSLIIAAAEFASCDTVWSEDLNDGQSYGSVTVRNPFAALT